MKKMSIFELKFTVFIVVAVLLFNVVSPSFVLVNGSFADKQAICTALGIKYQDSENLPAQGLVNDHCVLCLTSLPLAKAMLTDGINISSQHFDILGAISFKPGDGFVSQTAYLNSLSRAPPVNFVI